ncbi:unnamed protein product [Pleuronectes platessa]|uniref:Uncharacterized protein n=1 Tax=Pleuronectes platessa TaxID=8262 RepID=A0A9N7YKH4_PLEPL|nr:unnamed protein product [Pleuronectes platessa]
MQRRSWLPFLHTSTLLPPPPPPPPPPRARRCSSVCPCSPVFAPCLSSLSVFFSPPFPCSLVMPAQAHPSSSHHHTTLPSFAVALPALRGASSLGASCGEAELNSIRNKKKSCNPLLPFQMSRCESVYGLLLRYQILY